MKDLGFLETEDFTMATENNNTMSEEELFFAMVKYESEVM